MDKLPLFHEYRLIERGEAEVNGAWKGAHLLLFFMAFVFGSFCTFCFHMLMYLFDEKCVLFPKLLSLTSQKHNVIYEFLPVDKEIAETYPLDFLGTQWVEKSTCYLPTYVPLISGIFGLVWTTMFLMCSTGSRTLTGLQRPWRVLPPVFVFSVAMGSLCVYSSAVTQHGLDELCQKLGEITGSSTCTYTVNVATLAYERRIRGVYQAIQLTNWSAWLHTSCWLLSALLTLARVVLAVDFQLVQVSVHLIGDIDKMMEREEKQLHSVSPETWHQQEYVTATSLHPAGVSRVHFQRKAISGTQTSPHSDDIEVLYKDSDQTLYMSTFEEYGSEAGLLTEESHKLAKMSAYAKVPKDYHFIVRIVNDIILGIQISESDTSSSILTLSEDTFESDTAVQSITRQLGRSKLTSVEPGTKPEKVLTNIEEAEEMAQQIRHYLHAKKLIQLHGDDPVASTSTAAVFQTKRVIDYDLESQLNITEDMKRIIEKRQQALSIYESKSDLPHASTQTEKKKKERKRVNISDEITDEAANTEANRTQDVDKESQTKKDKEKQE